LLESHQRSPEVTRAAKKIEAAGRPESQYSTKMSTPKPLSRDELKAKEEVRRKLMALQAVDDVVYLQAIREHAESIECLVSNKAKNELMEFLNAKIRDLEIDALGSPRYSYNLHYPTDIGFAPNGRQPVFADKKFASTKEVSEFIRDYIKGDDMMFDKETYNRLTSTVSYIDMMLENSNKVEIDINDEDEDEDEEKVPLFTLTRTRINY
jgi:hypothetical protein